ncbi:MAG: ACT domain-containing protein [Thermoguttaceae bacterium]
MKIKQISVFIENKPGHIRKVCRTLADAGINLETVALADTEQFGILRFIVKDSEKAFRTLSEKGFVARETEVVAVSVDDKPGGLASILEIIDELHLNIEYMYGFHVRQGEKAVLVFRFNEPDNAVNQLLAKGVTLVSLQELLQ